MNRIAPSFLIGGATVSPLTQVSTLGRGSRPPVRHPGAVEAVI
jgi:hypothetical protein